MICQQCSNDLINVHHNTKFCEDCKKKRARIRNLEYQKTSMARKEFLKTYYQRPEVKKRVNACSRQYAKQHREQINLYEKEKRLRDPNYKVQKYLRTRIWKAIKYQYGSKSQSLIDVLGCSIEECRKYLESKFQDGMTWDNYGEWEIDHILPCASFDLTKEEEQKKCFHYTNLQPLWWRDNRTKGNKV